MRKFFNKDYAAFLKKRSKESARQTNMGPRQLESYQKTRAGNFSIYD